MGKLTVQQRLRESVKSWTDLWSMSGQQQTGTAQAWRHAVVPMPQSPQYIRFVATFGNDYRSDMAIDTISFASKTTLIAGAAATLSFPGGGWKITGDGKRTGNFGKWNRMSKNTPSGGTGPLQADTGTFYAYIESSGRNKGNPYKVAYMTSPELDPEKTTQVDWVYHMYGANLGKKDSGKGQLILQESTDGKKYTDIWVKKGQQQTSSTKAWLKAFIRLKKPKFVRFKGITGSGYRSDIAVDSVKFNVPVKDHASDDGNVEKASLDSCRAFDDGRKDEESEWIGNSDGWIGYDFGHPINISTYTIQASQF